MLRQTGKALATIRSQHRLFSTSPLYKTHPNVIWARKQFLLLPKECRVEAVQKDAAGTVVDPHCIGPFPPFSKVFSNWGFELSPSDIIGPMGMNKIGHIRHLVEKSKEKFFQKYGRIPNEEDINKIYQEFLQLLPDSILKRMLLTPGTDISLQFLLEQKIKFALTSGYPRSAADLATTELRKRFKVDAFTTADEVKDGTRIAMVEENNRKLGITSKKKTVLFSDACNDLESILGAEEPTWVFGVSDSSTHVEIISPEMEKEISPEELQQKRKVAHQKLLSCKPHGVIHNMTEVPLALVAIGKALARGLTPSTAGQLEIEYPSMEGAGIACRL